MNEKLFYIKAIDCDYVRTELPRLHSLIAIVRTPNDVPSAIWQDFHSGYSGTIFTVGGSGGTMSRCYVQSMICRFAACTAVP